MMQWLSSSSRVHQIRFWPGLRPGPRWGKLTTFLQSLLLVGWGGDTFIALFVDVCVDCGVEKIHKLYNGVGAYNLATSDRIGSQDFFSI